MAMIDPNADEILLGQVDMADIFEPVILQIFQLIDAQLEQTPDVKVLFVVGEFAEVPYLQVRVERQYGAKFTIAPVP